MELKRKPRLVACGGRDNVYERFVTRHSQSAGGYIAMWIDSEEPVINSDQTWEHLHNVTTVRAWERPQDAQDDQVLFMTTCMETWIVADRAALRDHYRNDLQETALPSLVDLENRQRHLVQDQLEHATRNCQNAYKKGKRSFEIFGRLNPRTLEEHLQSFARIRRILNAKL